MTVKFKLDSRAVPDGTVLLFGIRYEREPGAFTGPDKTYTYALMKAGGLWYTTGGGRVPQAAGWGAVERWLERDGRVVEWVRHVTETVQLWPPQESKGEPSASEGELATTTERSRGSEWRERARTAEDAALGYHEDRRG